MREEADPIAFQRWERELRGRPSRCERPPGWKFRRGCCDSRTEYRTGPRVPPRRNLSRADQLACYIARNYQQPLTSQSIADANGVHPNYAMNLFRQDVRHDDDDFITQHRISHAQRLLVTTDDAILNVALASGFQSLSRFNEAFKAACGCLPATIERRIPGQKVQIPVNSRSANR